MKAARPHISFWFIGVLFVFAQSSYAQQLNEDSLKQLIATATHDTVKVDALQQLANYQIGHLEQDSLGLLTLHQSYAIAEKANYTAGILQYQLILGNYQRSNGNWSACIELFNSMLITAGKLKNDSLKNRFQMMAYNNLGGIYNINGDFVSSLDNRIKAMEILELKNPDNYNSRGIIYLNIASDYRQLKIPVKALEYLNKTTVFFDSLSDRLKMEYYYEYHLNYLAADSVDLARQTLDQLQTGLRTYNLSAFQKKDYALMHAKLSADFYTDEIEQYPTAIGFATIGISLAKELKGKTDLADSYYRAGRIYLLMDDLTKAIQFLHIAYDSAAAHNLKNIMRKSSVLLAEAYGKKGNYGMAYQYERESRQISSAIYDQDKTREINFLESKYQHQKKEKEIAALQLINLSKELALSKRNKQLLVGSILAGAVLLVVVLLYRNSRQKQVIAEKDRMLQQEQIKFLERQQQVISLQSMVNGQETERTRIAKDLHDGLGGLFSTIKMHFSALQQDEAGLKEQPLFHKSLELIDTASEEVRRIAHNMMPEVLIKIGLLQAVRELCNSVSAGRMLQVSMQEYGLENRLNSSTEIMLFRIIQELLNNIIKHARATEAIIQFNKIENRLTITVEDNGSGFNLQAADQQTHFGLSSVQSRVDYLNGRFSIDSEKGIGTTILMEFLINE